VPWWAWALVGTVLGAGWLLGLVVVLLGLYVASGPDCSAVTAAGTSAQRIAGFVLVTGTVAVCGGAAVGAVRTRAPLLLRLAFAALPLVLVPLLVTTVDHQLEHRLDVIGDEGNGSSCF
jgi:Na+-driven multidrug efflux pump